MDVEITLSKAILDVTVDKVGPQGPTGPAGEGVSAGGDPGQWLRKTSEVDFDTEWADIDLSPYATTTYVDLADTTLSNSLNSAISALQGQLTAGVNGAINYTDAQIAALDLSPYARLDGAAFTGAVSVAGALSGASLATPQWVLADIGGALGFTRLGTMGFAGFSSGVRVGNGGQYAFSVSVSPAGSSDTGIARHAAGVVKPTNGGTGLGSFLAAGATFTEAVSVAGALDVVGNIQSSGQVRFSTLADVAGTVLSASPGYFRMSSSLRLSWSSTGFASHTPDLQMVRHGPAQMKLTDGGVGFGDLLARNLFVNVNEALDPDLMGVQVSNASASGVNAGWRASHLVDGSLDLGVIGSGNSTFNISAARTRILSSGGLVIGHPSAGGAAYTATILANYSAVNPFEIRVHNYDSPFGIGRRGTIGSTVTYMSGYHGNGFICGGQTEFSMFHSASALSLSSTSQLSWSVSNAAWGTKDTGLARDSAGVLKVTNGLTGEADLKLKKLFPTQGVEIPIGGFGVSSAGNQGFSITSIYGMQMVDTFQLKWSNWSFRSNFDTGLARDGVGVLKVTNGSTGLGDLKVRNLYVEENQLTDTDFMGLRLRNLATLGNASPNTQNKAWLIHQSGFWGHLDFRREGAGAVPVMRFMREGYGEVSIGPDIADQTTSFVHLEVAGPKGMMVKSASVGGTYIWDANVQGRGPNGVGNTHLRLNPSGGTVQVGGGIVDDAYKLSVNGGLRVLGDLKAGTLPAGTYGVDLVSTGDVRLSQGGGVRQLTISNAGGHFNTTWALGSGNGSRNRASFEVQTPVGWRALVSVWGQGASQTANLFEGFYSTAEATPRFAVNADGAVQMRNLFVNVNEALDADLMGIQIANAAASAVNAGWSIGHLSNGSLDLGVIGDESKFTFGHDGRLSVSEDPVSDLQVTTKQYVDGAVNDAVVEAQKVGGGKVVDSAVPTAWIVGDGIENYTTGTGSILTNRLYRRAVLVSNQFTCTRAAIVVKTAGAAGAKARVCLRKWDRSLGWKFTDLVWDSGQIDCSTTGVKQVAIPSVVVEPGWYVFEVICDDGSVAFLVPVYNSNVYANPFGVTLDTLSVRPITTLVTAMDISSLIADGFESNTSGYVVEVPHMSWVSPVVGMA